MINKKHSYCRGLLKLLHTLTNWNYITLVTTHSAESNQAVRADVIFNDVIDSYDICDICFLVANGSRRGTDFKSVG